MSNHSENRSSDASGGAGYTVAVLVGPGEQATFPDSLRRILANGIDGADILVLDLTESDGAVSSTAHSVARALPGSERHLRVQQVTRDSGHLFGRAIRHCMTHLGKSDVLFVTGRMRVPYGWDARLRRAANDHPQIATASPMCDISSLFGLLPADGDALTETSEPDAVDRMAYVLGDRRYYEIPSFFPGCVYIRGPALEAAAGHAERLPEGDEVLRSLAKTLRKRGYIHVICDHLYLSLAGAGRHWLSTSDELSNDEAVFAGAHPLNSVRHAVGDALKHDFKPQGMPALDARPVQLHVTHSWGGGLEKWVTDYSSAATDRINMVFKSVGASDAYGSRMALYMDARDKHPVRSWDLTMPIHSTAVAHLEYQRVIKQIIDEFSIDSVIVSSLIGHSLDALSTGKSTLIVGHDYYPFCPAIYIRFDGVCDSCDPQRLEQCFAENKLNSIVDDYSAEEWFALRESFHTACRSHPIAFVVPSHSVQRHLCQLDPRYKKLDFHVIPHGNPAVQTRTATEKPPERKRRRIVVLGRLTDEKGLDLFLDSRLELASLADLYLVGCGESGEQFATEAGIHIVPRYELHELPKILGEIAPDMGLLMSTWPETFSYTLSELMAYDIPPVATELGSFSERIEEGVTGFLCTPTKEALVECVRSVIGHPEKLELVRRNLAPFRHRSLDEMAGQYARLLPPDPLPRARYRLQIGSHTGLTEPYSQLLAAYRRLESSYRKLERAYRRMESAYNQVHQAYRELSEAYAAESQIFQQRGEHVDRPEQTRDKIASRISELSGHNRELEQDIGQLKSQLEAIQATRLWRFTEALKKVAAGAK